jgi:DNA repair exonuclease SbcCD ATPase subunit
LASLKDSITEQRALRAEFITAKTKAERADQATKVLEGVRYQRCPECGTDISDSPNDEERCRLCGRAHAKDVTASPVELEALRRDLNDRIDELQEELARYDSAFVESIRAVEREIATLVERIRSLRRLQQMPQAIDELEEDAGALQGRIDRLRTSVSDERGRLRAADANIAAIAAEFKRIMLSVSFPGVAEDDEVVIDPRNWKPTVVHGEQEWSFWDTGSGGKKTLFNVCYALAIHAVALERQMPVPGLLVIDSPTKNISEDENPELVRSLYSEIYRLARGQHQLQFLLIDSDLVSPSDELQGFLERRMAGEPDAPSLIPYYKGP